MTTATPKGTGTIIQSTGARHARIMGVGGYRPERVVPNSEIVGPIDSSDEWIRERSGIVSRRFAAKDESVVDMSEAATARRPRRRRARGSPGRRRHRRHGDPPYQTPAAAPILADRLGIRGAAFDISAACAGYCHGISLASDMVRGGSAQHVLVVGVEKLSDFTDPTDRGTAFIFGDGAGAAIVGPSDTPGDRPHRLGLGRLAVADHLAARQLGRAQGRGRPRLAGHRHGRASRSSAGRCGAWPPSPRRRSTPPASTRRGPRRLHPPPGEHADHRRDDQAAQAA